MNTKAQASSRLQQSVKYQPLFKRALARRSVITGMLSGILLSASLASNPGAASAQDFLNINKERAQFASQGERFKATKSSSGLNGSVTQCEVDTFQYITGIDMGASNSACSGNDCPVSIRLHYIEWDPFLRRISGTGSKECGPSEAGERSVGISGTATAILSLTRATVVQNVGATMTDENIERLCIQKRKLDFLTGEWVGGTREECDNSGGIESWALNPSSAIESALQKIAVRATAGTVTDIQAHATTLVAERPSNNVPFDDGAQVRIESRLGGSFSRLGFYGVEGSGRKRPVALGSIIGGGEELNWIVDKVNSKEARFVPTSASTDSNVFFLMSHPTLRLGLAQQQPADDQDEPHLEHRFFLDPVPGEPGWYLIRSSHNGFAVAWGPGIQALVLRQPDATDQAQHWRFDEN